MTHDIFLPVIYEQQGPIHLCGAACVNMVLSNWGKNYAQLDVWAAIQANTNSTRPSDAPKDPGWFKDQLCELCSTDTAPDGSPLNHYHCWFTSPAAMVTTLNQASPKPIDVTYIPDYYDAMRRLADSIATFAVPAVVTITPNLHWITTYGYQYQDVPPVGGSSVLWNGQYITGFYFLNPSTPPGVSDLTMVTPHGLGGLVMRIQCGVLAGKFPVVGGVAAAPSGSTVGEFWTWVVRWVEARRITVPRKQPRQPIPPFPPPPKRQ